MDSLLHRVDWHCGIEGGGAWWVGVASPFARGAHWLAVGLAGSGSAQQRHQIETCCPKDPLSAQ